MLVLLCAKGFYLFPFKCLKKISVRPTKQFTFHSAVSGTFKKKKRKNPNINWGFRYSLYKLHILPHLSLRTLWIEYYYSIPMYQRPWHTETHPLGSNRLRMPTQVSGSPQSPFLTAVLNTWLDFEHISRRERRKIECDLSKLCCLWMALAVRLYFIFWGVDNLWHGWVTL